LRLLTLHSGLSFWMGGIEAMHRIRFGDQQGLASGWRGCAAPTTRERPQFPPACKYEHSRLTHREDGRGSDHCARNRMGERFRPCSTTCSPPTRMACAVYGCQGLGFGFGLAQHVHTTPDKGAQTTTWVSSSTDVRSLHKVMWHFTNGGGTCACECSCTR